MDLTKNPEWNKDVQGKLPREGKVCVEKAVLRAATQASNFMFLTLLLLPSTQRAADNWKGATKWKICGRSQT